MKRVSRNFIAIIGSDISRRLLGMLTIVYLARKVGIAQFGVINIGFTVLTYALMVSSLGLSSYGARAVARNENGSLINKIISVRIITGLITFVIVVAATLLFVADALTASIIIVFCLSLFANAFLLDWFFQGKERMGIIGAGRSISAVAYLLVILIFVHKPDEIIWVAIAALSGDIFASIISWSYFRKQYGKQRFTFSLAGWKTMAAGSVSIGIGSILAALSVNLPPLVLGISASNQDVGIYSAAGKLVFFVLMIDRVLATLLLPATSRLHNYSSELLSSTLSLALKWVIIASLPVCVGGTLLAGGIIPLVFGPEYYQAVEIFRILIWFFLATLLHTIFTSGMIAIGQEKSYGVIMAVSAGIYLALVIICTKYFGVAGSAAAMVVAETATLLLMQQRFRKFVKLQRPSSLFRIISAVAVMGVVIAYLPTMHVLPKIIIGAIVYFVFLFISKAITRTELTNLAKRI